MIQPESRTNDDHRGRKQSAVSEAGCRTWLVSTALLSGLLGMQVTHADDLLWTTLAQGGKVVLMRHAPVEKGPGKGNALLRDLSCKEERKLSQEGEREARILGEAFRQRKIPLSEVRYSPFCRTSATASIAFGGGVPARYLSLLEILEPDEAAEQTAQLKRVIGSYTGDGNLVLITHEPNISAVSFELIPHSGFLVLQPGGDDEFEELGVMEFPEGE